MTKTTDRPRRADIIADLIHAQHALALASARVATAMELILRCPVQDDRTASDAPAGAPTQAAHPASLPVAQDVGRPVEVGKASDELAGGDGQGKNPVKSEELRHATGVEGERAAAADTTPVADDAPDLSAPKADEAPRVPRVASRLTEGGGLVQDGGVAQPNLTTADRLLNLWRDTRLTEQEVAADLCLSRSTVGVYLAAARGKKDPRVIAGDEVRIRDRNVRILNLYRTTKLTAVEIDKQVQVRAGTTRTLVEEHRKRQTADVVQGDKLRALEAVAEKPAALPSPPKPPAPVPVAAPAEAHISVSKPFVLPAIEPGHVIAVDLKQGVVVGHEKHWISGPKFARALNPLRDGLLYGLDTMMKAGGYATERLLLDDLPAMTRGLAVIGVVLVHTKHIGVKLNRVLT